MQENELNDAVALMEAATAAVEMRAAEIVATAGAEIRAEKPVRKPKAKPTDMTQTTKWRPGEIVSVSVKHLEIVEDKNDPLFDVRGLEPADDNLVADIKEDGFNSVIWAVERSEGILTIFAGRRRYRAAVEAKEKEISVKVFDSNLDAYALVRLMIAENERRHQDTSINKARKAKRLLELGIERLRPAAEGIKQDDEGNIEYTGDAWMPSSKQVREVMEDVGRAFGFKSYKRVKDQLLPLVEDLSPKVQKALEQGKIPEALALQWKDKTHEQQERALQIAYDKAAGEKIKGKGATRKGGEYPKLQFKRPQLEGFLEDESVPTTVRAFLGFYLGHHDLEQAPRWIQKLMAEDEEADAEEEE